MSYGTVTFSNWFPAYDMQGFGLSWLISRLFPPPAGKPAITATERPMRGRKLVGIILDFGRKVNCKGRKNSPRMNTNWHKKHGPQRSQRTRRRSVSLAYSTQAAHKASFVEACWLRPRGVRPIGEADWERAAPVRNPWWGRVGAL
jgi:hypothetical protein